MRNRDSKLKRLYVHVSRCGRLVVQEARQREEVCLREVGMHMHIGMGSVLSFMCRFGGKSYHKLSVGKHIVDGRREMRC